MDYFIIQLNDKLYKKKNPTYFQVTKIKTLNLLPAFYKTKDKMKLLIQKNLIWPLMLFVVQCTKIVQKIQHPAQLALLEK